jgi:hypothetical protein
VDIPELAKGNLFKKENDTSMEDDHALLLNFDQSKY